MIFLETAPNSRSLNYHPHIHVIVPGGGIIRSRKQWKKGKYLFKQKDLAKVFRVRFLAELNKCGLPIPKAPCEWIVDCRQVGKGISAIKYLSKYLYKGVISKKNIIANEDGKVTFQYVDSETKDIKNRTLPGEDFIHLILQHVLPKGFRRVRK